MSSTGINLPNGSNQLGDLLAFISDPVAYQAKLDALNQATKDAQDYIALVGPASEILAIRADIGPKQEQATQALADAKAAAADMVAKATEEAAATVMDAKDQAKKLVAAAKVKTTAADALMDKALAAQKSVDDALVYADKVQADYEAKSASLNARMSAAITAQAEAEAYRDSLAAKAQAFVQGL